MTFSRTNTWNAGEKLTATQINTIDENITECFDIRSGASATVNSTAIFNDTVTFNGTTNLSGTNVVSANLNYSSAQSRSIFIPASQLIPRGLHPSLSTDNSDNYLNYHYISYNDSNVNFSGQTLKFNLDLNAIPENASITSFKFVWLPTNFNSDPNSAGECFTFYYYRSKSLIDYFFSDPALVPNAMSDIVHSVLATGGYNWSSDRTSRTTELSLSPALVHKKSEEQHQINLVFGSKLDTALAGILFFGVQVNYTVTTIGVQ